MTVKSGKLSSTTYTCTYVRMHENIVQKHIYDIYMYVYKSAIVPAFM